MLYTKLPIRRVVLVRALFSFPVEPYSVNLIVFVSLQTLLNLVVIVDAEAIVCFVVELNSCELIEYLHLSVRGSATAEAKGSGPSCRVQAFVFVLQFVEETIVVRPVVLQAELGCPVLPFHLKAVPLVVLLDWLVECGSAAFFPVAISQGASYCVVLYLVN